MRRGPAFACLLVALGALAQTGLPFRPQTLPTVLRHSPTAQKYLPETMGGGVALLDYDADGLLDIFLVNAGQANAAGFRRAEPAYWNRLYRQSPIGTFTDVTQQAGLAAAPAHYGMGAAAGDIDNDGYVDLYLTGYGGTALYRNRGNGTFALTGEASVNGWSVSAAFLDYDQDGRLDLFVARYLDWTVARSVLCGTPFNAYCRPDKYPGTANVLFHNEGGGKFRDVSAATGVSEITGKGMGVTVNDYDADGRPDVFVANDGMEQFLLHNDGGGRFTERAFEAGVALSGDAKTFAGMGAAFADYDNDGRADIAVTNLALERYALYRNEGEGRFAYVSLDTGLAAATAPHSGWGVGLHDFDNDGWKDLFAAQSHVLDNVERIHDGLAYKEPPGLYRFDGEKFHGVAVGLPAMAARGAAFGDLNNDGAMDVVLTALGAGPVILWNRTARPGVTLRLKAASGNRDAVGAVVQAGRQTVYVTTSGSYLSASDPRVHLAGRPATVEIRWPSGQRQTARLAPGALATVEEKP